MRPHHIAPTILALLFGQVLATAGEPAPSDPSTQSSGRDAEETLAISEPVACKSIEGFEDYEPLPEPALTSDEKLLIYYRPLNYTVDHGGKLYRIRLTQDGQIRRRGGKAAIHRKEKLLDYSAESESRPGPIYLRNMVSLKGLKPGEYEFDIILHDAFAKRATATRTLPFRVIPAVLPRADDTDPDEKGPSPEPSRPKKRTR